MVKEANEVHQIGLARSRKDPLFSIPLFFLSLLPSSLFLWYKRSSYELNRNYSPRRINAGVILFQPLLPSFFPLSPPPPPLLQAKNRNQEHGFFLFFSSSPFFFLSSPPGCITAIEPLEASRATPLFSPSLSLSEKIFRSSRTEAGTPLSPPPFPPLLRGEKKRAPLLPPPLSPLKIGKSRR